MSNSVNRPVSHFRMIEASLSSLKLTTLLTLILLAICFLIIFSLLDLIFHQSLPDPGEVCNKAFQFLN